MPENELGYSSRAESDTENYWVIYSVEKMVQ